MDEKVVDMETKVETEKIIPILDISRSMVCSPFFSHAIRFACEHASLNRIMTIDFQPCWISLEDCHTIDEKINKIDTYISHYGGTCFQLSETIQLIIQSILITKLSNEHIHQLRLIIISNMQSMDIPSMNKLIYDMFYHAGIYVIPMISYSSFGNSLSGNTITCR
jgi:hypothetical protein